MIRPLTAAIAFATIATFASAAGNARPLKPEQEAKIHPSGPAVDCIRLTSIRETRVRDDQTIDFYTNGNTVYRNHLPNSCSELGFEERFGYDTSLSELCNVDIIHVIREQPAIQGASCGLGKFQPISGAPR